MAKSERIFGVVPPMTTPFRADDSIDESAHVVPLSGVSFQGSTFKFSVPQINASYEGTLSADGQSIKGKWKQGSLFQLDYTRPTAAAAATTASVSPQRC